MTEPTYNYNLTLTQKDEKGEPRPVQQINNPQLMEEIIKADLVQKNANTRLLETELFLRGMQEIRMALNWGSVQEGDAGVTERTPAQPMFDEINRGRLQQRYFILFDRFLAYTKMVAENWKLKEEKVGD